MSGGCSDGDFGSRWDPIDVLSFFRHDGTIPMSGNLDMGGNDITNANDVSIGGDLVVTGSITAGEYLGGSPVHLREDSITFGSTDGASIGITTVNIEGDDEDAWAFILTDENLLLALKSVTRIALEAAEDVFISGVDGVFIHAPLFGLTTPDADGNPLTIDEGGVHFGGMQGEFDPYVFEVLNSQDLATLHIDQVNSITTFYGDITFDSVSQSVFFPNGGTHVIGTLDVSQTLEVTGETLFLDKIKFTQTDGDEFIDSLTIHNLDIGATSAIGFHIGGTERLVITNTQFKPTVALTGTIDIGADNALLNNFWQAGTHYFGESSTGITPLGGGFLSVFAGSGIILGNDVLIEGAADVEGLLSGFAGAKLGDGGLGDYTEFGVDGFQVMHGASRVKNHVSVFATGAGPGISTPTLTTRAIGASGSVEVDVLRFSDVLQNDSRIGFCGPPSIDDSVNGHFVLKWIPGVTYNNSGFYRWVMEYIVKDADGDVTTGTPITISVDVTPGNNTDRIETVFPGSVDLDGGQRVSAHFYRDTASDTANGGGGDIEEWQFEYTQNKMGQQAA